MDLEYTTVKTGMQVVIFYVFIETTCIDRNLPQVFNIIKSLKQCEKVTLNLLKLSYVPFWTKPTLRFA